MSKEIFKFADEWIKGATFHADSQGWSAVCAVLAGEVRKLKDEKMESKKGEKWIN